MINRPKHIEAYCHVEANIEPEHNDKSEEISVICFTNAVVKPITVVVELVTAAVARSTVFSIGVHITFAHNAPKLKILWLIVLTSFC